MENESDSLRPRVIFIVGPTATRKTDIAAWIAKKINGEIVSADSMLVYKGMNIGTAKPAKKLQHKIRHHLIDILKPAQNFSVFDYRRLALKAISQIVARKKIPIVVGGSGLYIRALIRGLVEQPPADFEFRKAVEHRLQHEGLSALYETLKKEDPARAAEIKSGDARRIIRALEILNQSSQPPSKLRGSEISLQALGYDPAIVGITKNRAVLYRDIEKRVERMFRQGLVREVEKLTKGKLSATASQAVGYKEIIAALKGEVSLVMAKERIKINTRHLAKRQWTWFKRESGLEWVEWESEESLASMGKKVLKTLGF